MTHPFDEALAAVQAAHETWMAANRTRGGDLQAASDQTWQAQRQTTEALARLLSARLPIGADRRVSRGTYYRLRSKDVDWDPEAGEGVDTRLLALALEQILRPSLDAQAELDSLPNGGPKSVVDARSRALRRRDKEGTAAAQIIWGVLRQVMDGPQLATHLAQHLAEEVALAGYLQEDREHQAEEQKRAARKAAT